MLDVAACMCYSQIEGGGNSIAQKHGVQLARSARHNRNKRPHHGKTGQEPTPKCYCLSSIHPPWQEPSQAYVSHIHTQNNKFRMPALLLYLCGVQIFSWMEQS